MVAISVANREREKKLHFHSLLPKPSECYTCRQILIDVGQTHIHTRIRKKTQTHKTLTNIPKINTKPSKHPMTIHIKYLNVQTTPTVFKLDQIFRSEHNREKVECYLAIRKEKILRKITKKNPLLQTLTKCQMQPTPKPQT